MKKIAVLALICLLLGSMAPAVSAAPADETTVRQTIQALGIMVGNENGDMDLDGYVTRAQLAKMMVAASAYRDSVGTAANASPFKDVKYTHWAASYIRTAVLAGWVTGYTDGTYRPENVVRLEEAVSAVLKMLGYTAADFSGSFPEAQLAKYRALGLQENVTAGQGASLRRRDCMYLFYNLMGAKTKSGSTYAASLGYSVNSAGELDFSSLVLKDMKGPFIVRDAGWSSVLPFAPDAAVVYKNGNASDISALARYDVFYYNANLRTVWVYRDHVSGVFSAASPGTAAPVSVTVAGGVYPIAASAAAYALSDLGPFGIGDTVTLLLGMNGEVVGVEDATAYGAIRYGMALSTGTKSYTDSAGIVRTARVVSAVCTDGGVYEFEVGGTTIEKGDLLQFGFSGGGAAVKRLTEKGLIGSVDDAGTGLGSYVFADDIRILDTTANGSYCTVYPSRLAGISLGYGKVRCYALDESGELSDLILNDVTGDPYAYGVLTDVLESTGSPLGSVSVTASYTYILNGVRSSYSSQQKLFGISGAGPAQMEFSAGSLVRLRKLSETPLTSLSPLYAQSSDRQLYRLADDCDVYIYSGADDAYHLTNVLSVGDTDSYTLKGYYDKSPGEGGRIRIVIARER